MGGVVHPDDPVLVHLGEYGDERAYTNMVRVEPGISSALETRYGQSISAGYTIEPGDEGGKDAEELAEWCRSYLKSGLRNVDQVQRSVLEGVGYGWVPLNLIWGGWKAKGRSWYVPIRAKRKPHQNYRFSFPGHHLVHYWRYGDVPKVYPHRERGSEAWYRWMTPSYGEVESPYGDPLLMYVWMIYSVKAKFFRMWAAGMGRSMGVLHAKSLVGLGAQTGADTTGSFLPEEIQEQLLKVLEFLAAHNILVSMPGYDLSWLENVKYSEGWKDPLAYIDQWIQVAIVGEGLTATMGMSNAAGSRSAGEVTERKTARRSASDAQYLNAGMSDLLHRAIEWNFGEVDDDIRPRFVSKIGKKPDIEALTWFVSSGGRTSEGRVADALGVPTPPEVALDDVLGEHKPVSENAPVMPFGMQPGQDPRQDPQQAGGDQSHQDPAAQDKSGQPATGQDDQGQGASAARSASLAEFLREEREMDRRIEAASGEAARYVDDLVGKLSAPWLEALGGE